MYTLENTFLLHLQDDAVGHIEAATPGVLVSSPHEATFCGDLPPALGILVVPEMTHTPSVSCTRLITPPANARTGVMVSTMRGIGCLSAIQTELRVGCCAHCHDVRLASETVERTRARTRDCRGRLVGGGGRKGRVILISHRVR